MRINPEAGTQHGSFDAETIEILTDAGRFWIGVDNDGNTYVSSYTKSILVCPSASNRITLQTK